MSQAPQYIVIEGPIGVGKTTLAARIAQDLDAELVLESVDDNPFLHHFYEDRESTALATQLHFLITRLDQLIQLKQRPLFKSIQVADYLIEKDRLFAESTLNPLEFQLYQKLYERLVPELPVPDLVVYLQAPVSILQKRIKQRGRSFEAAISKAYLSRLIKAYTGFFHHYDASPLLIVNATEIDIVSVEDDYRALLEQICSIRSGRHYFNPLPH